MAGIFPTGLFDTGLWDGSRAATGGGGGSAAASRTRDPDSWWKSPPVKKRRKAKTETQEEAPSAVPQTISEADRAALEALELAHRMQVALAATAFTEAALREQQLTQDIELILLLAA